MFYGAGGSSGKEKIVVNQVNGGAVAVALITLLAAINGGFCLGRS